MSKILVVVIDALRPDFLSCYGHPYSDVSKAIDFYAGRGSVFLQAHGGANTPHGMAMLLTGRHDYNMDEWRITLEQMKPSLIDFFPNFYMLSANLIPKDFAIASGGDPEKCIDMTVPGCTLADEAIKNIIQVDNECDNWLYTVWFMDVHEYKKFDICMYPRGRKAIPPFKRTEDAVALDDTLPTEYLEIMRRSQYTCAVKYVDLMIDRLLCRLAEKRIKYDWLVIMGDHAEYLEPYYTHGRHWQYQITHAPLIIVGMDTVDKPMTRRNSITDRVDLCDVAATLVDLSGQSIPDEWHGRSLKEYFRMVEK